MTNGGAGNPVLFAFDGGANGGWFKAFQTSLYDGSPDHRLHHVAISASFTEGKSCPGALMLAANFNAYGTLEGAHDRVFLRTLFHPPRWTELDRVQGAPRVDQSGDR